ncbi:hypothetical protein EXN66_Car010146 [Channa argus]|uniref:Uncharacterized protein n=1 Tax=Channa argus TaxID=215402 RepID=A0A6G1PVX2_CHAAH|nr:hypothetical protein EXN66_Car010146 [Channa argus]
MSPFVDSYSQGGGKMIQTNIQNLNEMATLKQSHFFRSRQSFTKVVRLSFPNTYETEYKGAFCGVGMAPGIYVIRP